MISKLIVASLTMMSLMSLPATSKSGQNYYIDPQGGNDNATGRSPKTAWRTTAKLGTLKLSGGDSLLLKRGTTLNALLEITAAGRKGKPVVIGAYGTGRKPCVKAPDKSMFAVQVLNSDYLTIENLEIVNTGSEPQAGRTGIKVSAHDFGVSHDIVLRALDVHDVNGSLIKEKGGGSGILIVNGGKEKVSIFDGLTIEDCTVRRCERNAIIWGGYADRRNWHPSLRTVVRRNLIEEVPGDGIVPIGCDGALVEYNLMRRCPGTLPHSEAAAGFWPWSCDNTVLRFNEVSDHKAPWDAQGFDSDYNCRNTKIEYNYSHDNDGGMVLICNTGRHNGAGNVGSVVQYNVSINDAQRPRATRGGIFSPTIHIAGPVKNTLIYRNILHVTPKKEPFIDRTMISADNWDGYADSTTIKENIFFAPEESQFLLTRTTNNKFEGNYYLGFFKSIPADDAARKQSAVYDNIIRQDPSGAGSLGFLFDTFIVGDGAAVLKAVNKDAIKHLFDRMEANQAE